MTEPAATCRTPSSLGVLGLRWVGLEGEGAHEGFSWGPRGSLSGPPQSRGLCREPWPASAEGSVVAAQEPRPPVPAAYSHAPRLPFVNFAFIRASLVAANHHYCPSNAVFKKYYF